MIDIHNVKNSQGVPFTLRVVRRGDGYGLLREDGTYPLINESDDPLIEFYDRRYPHTPYGQFISRYYARTLAHSNGGSLWLDMGIEDWLIDGEAWSTTQHLARSVTTHPDTPEEF